MCLQQPGFTATRISAAGATGRLEMRNGSTMWLVTSLSLFPGRHCPISPAVPAKFLGSRIDFPARRDPECRTNSRVHSQFHDGSKSSSGTGSGSCTGSGKGRQSAHTRDISATRLGSGSGIQRGDRRSALNRA